MGGWNHGNGQKDEMAGHGRHGQESSVQDDATIADAANNAETADAAHNPKPIQMGWNHGNGQKDEMAGHGRHGQESSVQDDATIAGAANNAETADAAHNPRPI